MPYNDHDFFIFARERVQFRRKQTSEREKFNEKQRMEMEEFQKEAQIRQVCPSIFFFALVFVSFLRLCHWFYFYFMLCFDFTSLLGSDWARPCRKGERSWGEWKEYLELPANDQSEFFNQDLIWLILLWLIYSRALLEEYNLWLSTLGANSPTVTLGHRPLGREKTQGGRISSGCEVGFIIIC